MEIYGSAHKHGSSDEDIEHAVVHAMVVAEDGEDKVLYLAPDRAGNLLEVVAVQREDGSEVAIHAMPMRRTYEALLPRTGRNDD